MGGVWVFEIVGIWKNDVFFVYIEYVFIPTTVCEENIEPKTNFTTTPIIVCLSKYPPPIFVIGGDTPFCAFGYEIKDFYLTRKKTGRRYGRRVFNSIFYFI